MGHCSPRTLVYRVVGRAETMQSIHGVVELRKAALFVIQQ